MSDCSPKLGADWYRCLADEFKKDYWPELHRFLEKERSSSHEVFPSCDEVFAAFRLTPLGKVKVVILGQDPYPGAGQAHGLAFSVPHGARKPRTLQIIHKELNRDLGLPIPDHGSLEAWACRGVLLLNATLTVREGKRGSHRRKGWEGFTEAAIRCVNAKTDHVVFLLWGRAAQRKSRLIDKDRHTVICSSHPSPLSFKRAAPSPFHESGPFKRANRALRAAGRGEIDWDLTKDCSD